LGGGSFVGFPILMVKLVLPAVWTSQQSHADDGDSPSGKASDSGSDIGGSNPSSPAIKMTHEVGLFLWL
jgi:hypothetical protein